MKSLLLLIFIVSFISSPFLFSQEQRFLEKSYPTFIPYVNAQNYTLKDFVKVDIKDLGSEQPARWLSVDPLADKYPGWSPYNYCINNPLKFIDPNGDSVWVYAERLGSGTFSNGNRNWMESIIGYLSRPDHSIVRIKTNDIDKTIELTGKGDILLKDTDINRIAEYEFNLVQEPFSGLLNANQLENFDYENKLLETSNLIYDNKDLLPKYDYMQSNSNGFANALIQSTGGKVEFSRGSYFNYNISPFIRSFEYIQKNHQKR